MFKRKWRWFGKLVSDEGFEISFAHNSVYYQDGRGKFEFGYEDGLLSGTPYQLAGEPALLSQADIDEIVDRVVRGIQASGDEVVQVFRR